VKCYVVRIYREDRESGFAGIVENVGGAKQAFANFDELCAILNPGKKKRRKKERRETPCREGGTEKNDAGGTD
jgi:hypothetical protein